MREYWKGFVSATVGSLLLAAGVVVAQDEGLFEQDEGAFGEDDGVFDWDSNGDGIDTDEWNEGFGEANANAFSDWDADGDGLLSEDEFNEGVFDNYDTNDDDILDDDEFLAFEDDAGDEGFWDV